MNREEIANELFHTGKEVKQCFLNELALPQSENELLSSVYPQYLQIINNLNILYRSLDTGTNHFDLRIDDLVSSFYTYGDISAGNPFAREYISILNDMLLSVIRLRGKYCLIRRNDPVPGLASHVITNLGQIAACLNNGYLPFIDTVNVDNIFSALSKEYNTNAWELYFNQPFGISYNDFANGQELKITDGIPNFMPTYSMDCLLNPNLISFWRTVMRNYMPVSSLMTSHVDSCLNQLPFNADAKILGVLCRGTDYTNLRPYNHPVQPPLNLVLTKTDELMRKHQCDYCYLATEDQEILKAFRDKLSDKLLITQDIYYQSDLKKSINQTNQDHHIDLHSKNIEYLTALILLSKCQYFIGGRTSGTVVALLLSDGFQDRFIWNLGRYGIDDSSALDAFIF